VPAAVVTAAGARKNHIWWISNTLRLRFINLGKNKNKMKCALAHQTNIMNTFKTFIAKAAILSMVFGLLGAVAPQASAATSSDSVDVNITVPLAISLTIAAATCDITIVTPETSVACTYTVVNKTNDDAGLSTTVDADQVPTIGATAYTFAGPTGAVGDGTVEEYGFYINSLDAALTVQNTSTTAHQAVPTVVTEVYDAADPVNASSTVEHKANANWLTEAGLYEQTVTWESTTTT
ncbi:MAG: hypothetical protein ACD_76C00137G0004, partial [uncultured bacterium]